MGKIRLVSDLLQHCKSVSVHGELLTLVELSEYHKDIEWWASPRGHPYDILCDKKKIEVKSCNVDNNWAKKTRKKDNSFESGFDRINPDRFDYVVCVSFNSNFKDVKFYVFTPEEVKLFDKSVWKSAPNAYVIEIRKHSDDRRNTVIQHSRDAWHKIQCMHAETEQ